MFRIVRIAAPLAVAGVLLLRAGAPAAGPCRLHDSTGPALPDPACTPGAVRTADTATICRPGYARSVRNVPYALKRRVYARYGIARHPRGSYEVDHLVPLELGGSNAAANLWPQPARPPPGFREKDALENVLHDEVCAGSRNLHAVQRAIVQDWIALWRREGRSSA